MPKNQFVDFKAVKFAVSREQMLQHYGLLEKLKLSGDSLTGACPIHKGSNPAQFRVSLGKNLWNCFRDCKCGGNVLDFISKMDGVSVHAAALKAVDWFGLNRDAMSSESDRNSRSVRKLDRSILRPLSCRPRRRL